MYSHLSKFSSPRGNPNDIIAIKDANSGDQCEQIFDVKTAQDRIKSKKF